MFAIETHHICKDFSSGEGGWTRVLHDVSINVPAGELAMLVGPSGCGKTTLLSIISGILKPTEGEAKVYGEPVTSMRDHEKVVFRRRNMGFIFQQYNLLPALTAAENAAVALVADGMELGRAVVRTREILGEIGMGAHADKVPAQLSGGQQQRVAIARALAHAPRLLICDEPTAALDAVTGQKVLELLRNVVQDGRSTVLVVTHDNRIFHFADRIFHMDDGRILDEQAVTAGVTA